jgi:hypothetical protein
LKIYEESLSVVERLLGDGGGPELAQCPDIMAELGFQTQIAVVVEKVCKGAWECMGVCK